MPIARTLSRLAARSPTIEVLARLLHDNGRAYIPRYLVAFLFMGVFAASTALSAWMMRDVINKIFVARDTAALAWIPIAIFAIFTVKGASSFLQEVTLARIGRHLIAETQKRMFDHMLQMNMAFFHRHPSKELIAHISECANATRTMLNLVVVSIGRDAMTLAGLVVVMVMQDPVMSSICLLGGPVIALTVRRLSQQLRKITRRRHDSVTEVIGAMRETAQGIRIIKAFQLEDLQRKRMHKGVDAAERAGTKIVTVQAGMNGLVEVVAGLAIGLVVLYAGWRNFSFGDTPGQFFAFIAALLMASDPLRRLSRVQLQLASAAVGVRMMYEFLDIPASEKPVPAPDLAVRSGEVRFKDVSFSYEPGTPVLSHLDFVAPAGCTTALVGASGGGKTTVFNLLQGFWMPDSGTVLIDGQPIAETSLASLRRQIALVSQDVFLFEGTIRENIAAGRQDATDEEVAAAARSAHADGFIRSLPKGYGTEVGELGAQVSGGQRQRITLARAFLKNAPIVLLDEPTSALDAETEVVIQRGLAELTKGRTTLVIAHRLATILQADLIHVIEGGRVIESGTHSELIRAKGAYARLYDLQFKSEGEHRLAV